MEVEGRAREAQRGKETAENRQSGAEQRLVVSEMDMAARIRHPNLLLFIGATLEGEMVILTELMLTSLT